MKDYGTLSEAINKLKKEEGYLHDFNLTDEHLTLSEKEKFSENEFKVDKFLRFEGMSNPDDNAILFAITTSDGKKGTLLDGYGISSGQVSKKMMKKLQVH